MVWRCSVMPPCPSGIRHRPSVGVFVLIIHRWPCAIQCNTIVRYLGSLQKSSCPASTQTWTAFTIIDSLVSGSVSCTSSRTGSMTKPTLSGFKSYGMGSSVNHLHHHTTHEIGPRAQMLQRFVPAHLRPAV